MQYETNALASTIHMDGGKKKTKLLLYALHPKVQTKLRNRNFGPLVIDTHIKRIFVNVYILPSLSTP